MARVSSVVEIVEEGVLNKRLNGASTPLRFSSTAGRLGQPILEVGYAGENCVLGSAHCR